MLIHHEPSAYALGYFSAAPTALGERHVRVDLSHLARVQHFDGKNLAATDPVIIVRKSAWHVDRPCGAEASPTSAEK